MWDTKTLPGHSRLLYINNKKLKLTLLALLMFSSRIWIWQSRFAAKFVMSAGVLTIPIKETEEGYEPVWIDPPRAAIWRLRRRRGRVVDLSDLAGLAVLLIGRYDRMRFLLRYLGPDREAGAAAQLWRDIDARLSRRGSREQDLRPRSSGARS